MAAKTSWWAARPALALWWAISLGAGLLGGHMLLGSGGNLWALSVAGGKADSDGIGQRPGNQPSIFLSAAGDSAVPGATSSGSGQQSGRVSEEALRSEILLRRYSKALDLLSRFSGLSTRLQFLKGYLYYRTKQWSKAVDALTGVLDRVPLVSGWIRLYVAQSKLRLKDWDGALDECRKAGAKGPWREPCALISAAALRHKGQWGLAAATYRALLGSKPRSGRIEARFRLMEALSRTGGSKRSLVMQYRFLESEAPLSRWTRKARALARRLHLAIGPLSCKLALLRARGLLSAKKFRAAHKAFSHLVRRCKGADRCRAAYYAARCLRFLRRRRRALPAFQRAVRFCDRRDTTNLKVKSLYQAGKTARSLGRYGLARAYFRRIEREHPHHSYADDAAYKIAETWAMEGDERRADKEYGRVVRRYPKGDMAQEALWRLVRAAWARKDDQALQRLVDTHRHLVLAEKGYHAACRVSYWYGRSLARSGNRVGAAAVMEQVVGRCPLTYYSYLAWSRLSLWDPVRAKSLSGALTRASKAPAGAKAAPVWGDAPFRNKAGFKRARFLAAVWLGQQMLQELEGLGLTIPRGKPSKKLVASLDEVKKNRLWAAADLLDHAGLYHLSHWLPRHLLTDYASHFPSGPWRRKWEIAYPRAFAKLVSGLRQVPHALLFGLMREESAFNPRQVSHARAVGLTQVLVSTARRFAGRKRVTVASLKDPSSNLAIGAKYLGYLLRYFHGRSALAVAAYNAGERRVRGWLRRMRGMELDEFVENIPFWETRLYTKRVLGSAFAYSVLWDGTPTVVRNWGLPSRVGARRAGRSGSRK